MSDVPHCTPFPLPPLPLQEHLKILHYLPEDENPNRKIRNVGLSEAMVNFTKTFSVDKPCEVVHTQRKRQVFYEAEPNIWMIMVSRSRLGEAGVATIICIDGARLLYWPTSFVYVVHDL